jgi:hypothetical protein
VEAAIAAIAAEREACARICDKQYERARTSTGAARADACATAIRARTALAQPEPEGVTDEEWCVLKMRLWEQYETVGYQGERFMYDADFYTALDVARQEITRHARPTIEPVPVAERPWEREGWCDAEGMCWLHRPAEIPCRLANGTLYRWVLDTPCRDEEEPVHDTHSLPHHALPVPGA